MKIRRMMNTSRIRRTTRLINLGPVLILLLVARVFALNTAACPMAGKSTSEKTQRHETSSCHGSTPASSSASTGSCHSQKHDDDSKPSQGCEGDCCPTCKFITSGSIFLPKAEHTVSLTQVPATLRMYSSLPVYSLAQGDHSLSDDFGSDISRPLNVPLRL
jgi:hypothetical protein